jgi:hypothetical protein
MAVRLARLERELAELNDLASEREREPDRVESTA